MLAARRKLIQLKESNMNRKDKLQKIYNKRLKRARAKLKTTSKERYISKADRAKIEAENSAVESDSEKSESL